MSPVAQVWVTGFQFEVLGLLQLLPHAGTGLLLLVPSLVTELVVTHVQGLSMREDGAMAGLVELVLVLLQVEKVLRVLMAQHKQVLGAGLVLAVVLAELQLVLVVQQVLVVQRVLVVQLVVVPLVLVVQLVLELQQEGAEQRVVGLQLVLGLRLV